MLSSASAQSWSDGFDLREILDIPVQKLVNCVNYSSGEWDHSVYFHKAELANHKRTIPDNSANYDIVHNTNYLIVVSHGVNTGNSSYMIAINGQQRSDYAVAVEEVLQHWEREGMFRGLKYDWILVHTCYSGKAKYLSYNLSNFYNKRMTFATAHSGVNAYGEHYDKYDGMRLRLSKAYPKNNSSYYLLDADEDKGRPHSEEDKRRIKMHICGEFE